MGEKKRYNFKKIFGSVLWALLGMGTVILLGAAINIKNSKCCKGIQINIKGVKNNFFIDKNEVNAILKKLNGGELNGRTIHSISISKMEEALQKNPWIKNAELYFDNNEILSINITEREPVARIFTNSGSSFYIDSTISILPLSEKFSARVPMFTGFYSANMFSKADSNLLREIKNIGTYILNNPFWMAQIDQVDITADKTFEMIPKVGNQIIVFGSDENYEEKFNNLLTFYRQVETKVGWNKYSKINIQYKNQVVAVQRGKADIIEDSLRAKQIMQTIVANAQKAANDSIHNIQLEQTQDDSNVPVAKSTDDSSGEKVNAIKPFVTPDKTIQTSAEKPNPAADNFGKDKKTTIAVPEKKLPTSYEKPFWLKSANKRLPVKTKSIPHQKSLSVPKKSINTTINKPVAKPKIKSKTETPSNDY